MVRVKMLRGNETAIIDNGKSYLFDMGGRCTAEDAGCLGSYMEGSCDLPVISVLTSGRNTEIGVSFPGQDKLRRYKSDMDAMMIAGTLQMARGFIKMLRRSGKQVGVRFNQILFVYRGDFDVAPLLAQLHATEV